MNLDEELGMRRLLMTCLTLAWLWTPGQASPGPSDLMPTLQSFLSRFEEIPGCSGARLSLWLARRGRGQPILAYEAHRNMIPASTLKVVTAASVLEHYGASDRLKTRLVFDGRDQLALVGAGDPELTASELQALARQTAGQLPRKVTRLYVDSRLFPQPRYPRGWSWDDLGESYAPEVRALLVDHGWVSAEKRPPWLGEPQRALLLKPTEDRANLRDVDVAAGHALAWALGQEGVEVGEVVRIAKGTSVERFQEVGAWSSRPVYEILRQAMAVSDNLAMECLHRLCLEERPRAVRDRSDIRIVDGSGLSRYNLVPCQILGELLLSHPTLKDYLPAPGGAGTLRKRFVRTALEDSLRAKTGTMGGVSGLAGEFSTGGSDYVFAMLTNGYVGPAKPIKDAEEDCLLSLQAVLAGGLDKKF